MPVGADPDDDVLVHGDGSDPASYFGVHTSRDGRWLVVSRSVGTAPRDDVWVADLAEDGVLREFQVGALLGGHCTGIEAVWRLRELAGLTRETCVVSAVGSSFESGRGLDPLDLAR